MYGRGVLLRQGWGAGACDVAGREHLISSPIGSSVRLVSSQSKHTLYFVDKI